MEIHKIRIPVPNGFVNDGDGHQYVCTHLEISVNYELGGISVFTGQKNERGYYLHVKPVTVRKDSVRFEMFSGAKFLLTECARKGKRKEAIAMAMYEKNVREAVRQLYGDSCIDFGRLPKPTHEELRDDCE